MSPGRSLADFPFALEVQKNKTLDSLRLDKAVVPREDHTFLCHLEQVAFHHHAGVLALFQTLSMELCILIRSLEHETWVTFLSGLTKP